MTNLSDLVWKCFVLFKITLALATTTNVSQVTKYCRNRGIFQDMHTYSLSSCSSCYGFLFPTKSELRPANTWLIAVNGTSFEPLTRLAPDVHNDSSVTLVCKTLSQNECEDWLACCQAATDCCRHNYYTLEDLEILRTKQDVCPKTWDGFACWEDSLASTTVSRHCPAFIQHGNPSMRAFKTCTENATWFLQHSSYEWTDYTKCVDLSDLKMQSIVSVACNIASLVVLIPSIVICIAYRSLRVQHRVRLHIHLFFSFVFYSVVNVLWDVIVTMEQLDKANSVMNRNPSWCRFLNAMTRYSRGTNYMWMFCEACFLHRLIVNAFEPPESLLFYYIIGWGFSWIPVTIYSSLRVMLQQSERCWVSGIGAWEWLLDAPNLFSLGINLIFLVNILRILLTQLQSHPNEPSNYRKALKATFVLVPLFGLQMLVATYRPLANYAYDIFAAFVTNSQVPHFAINVC